MRRAAVHCWPEMIVAAAASAGAIALDSTSSKTRQHAFAAELERELLQGRRRGRHDLLADGGRAGEADDVDLFERDQVLARPRCRVSITRLTVPAGSAPTAARCSSTAAVTRDVCGAGLTIAVQPAASAGASERISSSTGPFHGTMIAATPAGSRKIVEKTPGSISCAFPRIARAWPA